MANNFTSNPIVIDTVFTTTSYKNQAGVAKNTALAVDQIYWYQPAAPADLFSIKDGSNNAVILQGYCENANQSQVFPMYGRPMTDFTVPTLGSGILFIYYH